MQIIVDGREIKGDLAEHLKGRIVTSRRQTGFLLEITTAPKDTAVQSILDTLDQFLDGAGDMMFGTSMAIACGDEDAPERLREALDFWCTFAQTCDLLLSLGYNVDESGRFAEVDRILTCIEHDASTLLDISHAFGELADEAEWWRERIHDAAGDS